MDCLSNEADSMPPSGHPIREVRPTPWEFIQEALTERQDQYRATSHFALVDKVHLLTRLTDVARVRTFRFIRYSDLHGL